jgi:RND family efflux transporter MFP subunit
MTSPASPQPGERLRDLGSLRIDRDALEERPAGGRWGRRLALLAVVGALGAAGLFAYRRWVEPLGIPEVEVVQAEVQAPTQASALLTASGYVVAQRKAAVTAKIPGRLAELKVREGSRVKTGDVIARIENKDYVALQDQARRQLDSARAAHAETVAREYQSRREFERQTRLLKEGVSSPSDFDLAEAAHKVALAQIDSAAAEVTRAEAGVTVANVNLQNTLIVAPFDGIVTTKNADIGEIIAPVSVGGPASGNSLVEIADMGSLEAEVDINESHIARLREGQPAEIVLDAYPDVKYPGVLRQIVPTANRQKATIQGKVAFLKKGDEVLPEMSARVTFLEERPAEGAPSKARVFAAKNAIATRGGGPAAVVVRGGRAIVVPLKLGPEIDGRVEILAGLEGGESLVVNPTDEIRNGTPVRLRPKS